MFAMDDGRIVVYGGYYREKIKKDYDKGIILIDMYILTPESKCSLNTYILNTRAF